jgi:hypothetical protein
MLSPAVGLRAGPASADPCVVQLRVQITPDSNRLLVHARYSGVAWKANAKGSRWKPAGIFELAHSHSG